MPSRLDEAFGEDFISGTISGVRKGETAERGASKVTLRAFELRGRRVIQFTFLLGDRALHENCEPRRAGARTEELLRGGFSQAALFTRGADLHVTCIGRPPRLKVMRRPPTKAAAEPRMAHDRKKEGVFVEGEPCAFLEALGVMNAEGRVLAQMRDKFRQINKYLELVEGTLKFAADARLDRTAPLRIVDFGCGKAYLTFAAHWFCTERMGVECETLGVDLKSDVIEKCAALARRLGMDGLRFSAGDIAEAAPRRVDVVLTLHACDTATDLALAYAVRNGASAAVCVPCCQHELFRQLESETQRPLLRGILRERVAALVTDASRAQLMEAFGYRVEAVEFIDAEHTPKNIMLRCTRRPGRMRNAAALRQWREFAGAWSINPALARLLDADAEEGAVEA